jgi:hypothetical protein
VHRQRFHGWAAARADLKNEDNKNEYVFSSKEKKEKKSKYSTITQSGLETSMEGWRNFLRKTWLECTIARSL